MTFEENKLHNLSGRTGSLMYMAPEVHRSEKYNEKVRSFIHATLKHVILSIHAIGFVDQCLSSDSPNAAGGHVLFRCDFV